MYILPSTVGYLNHDCTRAVSPAYSLFWRPSPGKIWRGWGLGGWWRGPQSLLCPRGPAPGLRSDPGEAAVSSVSLEEKGGQNAACC